MKLHITIEKSIYGSLTLSTVINDRYYHKQYYGYTKREAIKLFKEFITNN